MAKTMDEKIAEGGLWIPLNEHIEYQVEAKEIGAYFEKLTKTRIDGPSRVPAEIISRLKNSSLGRRRRYIEQH